MRQVAFAQALSRPHAIGVKQFYGMNAKHVEWAFGTLPNSRGTTRMTTKHPERTRAASRNGHWPGGLSRRSGCLRKGYGRALHAPRNRSLRKPSLRPVAPLRRQGCGCGTAPSCRLEPDRSAHDPCNVVSSSGCPARNFTVAHYGTTSAAAVLLKNHDGRR